MSSRESDKHSISHNASDPYQNPSLFGLGQSAKFASQKWRGEGTQHDLALSGTPFYHQPWLAIIIPTPGIGESSQ